MATELETDEPVYHTCPRYHGTSDPYYQLCKQKLGVPTVQGRGSCTVCGHQVFFSPRDEGIFNTQLASVRHVRACIQCVFDLMLASEPDLLPPAEVQALLDADTRCRETPCVYALP